MSEMLTRLDFPEIITDEHLDFAIDEVALNGVTAYLWRDKEGLLTPEMFKYDAWGQDGEAQDI